jgi:uncharacterized RDD family membrane protein YckC
MSSAPAGLAVDSVTGIDVSLPVAGPGVRAFAFVIDWHIRLILALTWFAAAAVIYNRRWSFEPPLSDEPRWFGAVVAPALAIYFLYHLVLELTMRGRTPGKRIAGVRIVARDGGAPRGGALLARNVFRLIDSLPLLYGVGLVSVLVTREHVRIGDMAAGTLLVYEGAQAPALHAAPPGGRLDAVGAEIVAELLERWPGLTAAARTALARQVLARYGEPLSDADQAALHAALTRLAAAPGPRAP